MSNNNDNNNQENQIHQVVGDELNDALPQAFPRGSREITPNDMSEHADGGVETRDELLQKIIDSRIDKALEALVSRLPAAPTTPNNNTLENSCLGLANSGNGATPSIYKKENQVTQVILIFNI